MSNIEQILSKCDNCKLNECDGCITCSDMQVIKARIKELEEENLHWRGQYYLVTRKIGVLPKQKIKDAIKKIAEYKIARETNKGYYYDYFINQDYKEDFIKLFNKLLED